MDRRVKISTVGALFAALSGSTLLATPANALEPKPVYVSSSTSAATVTQILASGDKVGTSSEWQGVPDGMGGVKNSNGTVSVYVTHELSASDPFVAKTERPYGGFGATISKVTVNKGGTKVSKVENAINKVSWFDYSEGAYSNSPIGPVDAADADSFGTPTHSTALNRFCSATMVAANGFRSDSLEYEYKTFKVKQIVNVRYVLDIDGKTTIIRGKQTKLVDRILWRNSDGKWTTKKVKRNVTYGTSSPIFLTGEEGGDESRIFALETKTGELVQLPALGLGATENVSIAAKTGKATVAVIGEDGDVTDSQLFVYKGTKTRVGTWAERAGLTNGKRYVASISSLVNTAFSTPANASVAANAAISNDVVARGVIAPATITSAVRGYGAATSSAIAISNGVATVTANNSFIVGEFVSITGLTAEQKAGIDDIKNVQITAADATSYKFMTNAVDAASTSNSSIVATPDAKTVVVTTSAAHKLLEGDTVRITFAGSAINGKYTVAGVPSTTKFIVKTAGTGRNSFSVTAGSKATRLLDVAFKEVATNVAGDAQQVSAKLRGTEFSRVEDGEFNPRNKNEYFFTTTQTDADGTGYTSNTGGGLWKMTFVNVSKPELGASLELILDGSEVPSATTGDATPAKINKLDNLTFSADGSVVFLQEDPGGNDHVARLLAVRLSDKKLVTVAKFDSAMFGAAGDAANANAQLTNDEESSGVFDATKLFGGSGSTFMFNAQIHPVSTLGGLNSSSSGSSFGSDPLKTAATALLRPDLRTKATEVSVTGVSVAAESSSTSGSTTTHNRRMTLTVASTDAIAANDIINVVGLTRAHNGTYAVRSVDTVAKTVLVDLYSRTNGTVLAARYDNPAVVGTGRLFVSDADQDLAIKDAIIEGGALYTLKISSLPALFN